MTKRKGTKTSLELIRLMINEQIVKGNESVSTKHMLDKCIDYGFELTTPKCMIDLLQKTMYISKPNKDGNCRILRKVPTNMTYSLLLEETVTGAPRKASNISVFMIVRGEVTYSAIVNEPATRKSMIRTGYANGYRPHEIDAMIAKFQACGYLIGTEKKGIYIAKQKLSQDFTLAMLQQELNAILTGSMQHAEQKEQQRQLSKTHKDVIA